MRGTHYKQKYVAFLSIFGSSAVINARPLTRRSVTHDWSCERQRRRPLYDTCGPTPPSAIIDRYGNVHLRWTPPLICSSLKRGIYNQWRKGCPCNAGEGVAHSFNCILRVCRCVLQLLTHLFVTLLAILRVKGCIYRHNESETQIVHKQYILGWCRKLLVHGIEIHITIDKQEHIALRKEAGPPSVRLRRRQYNGRRVWTTGYERRTLFTTVDNTVGETTVVLDWQQLWSGLRPSRTAGSSNTCT